VLNKFLAISLVVVTIILALGVIAAAAAFLTHRGIAAVIDWLKARAVAKPNHRSSHTVPTPQGGGIVVVPAMLLTSAIALWLAGSHVPGGPLYAALVGVAALGLTVVGFIDDIRRLSIAWRLVAQVLALAVAIGLMPSELRILPAPVPLVVERILLIGAALWFVNLFNFMDGIDLISVVETIGIALGVIALTAFGFTAEWHGIVAAAVAGAMLGFAPWNAPAARLFLGDAGSIPIGFLLAVLLIHVAAEGALVAAVVLPLYYLADATITLMRRFLRGERVWEGHRQHFYQQATRNGLTVVDTVRRIAVLDAMLIVLAVIATLRGSAWTPLAALVGAAVAVGWLLHAFARGRS
jgi:UDP-N-acetylmuramyl pentapeptide phosphotransferase/UDP-N-acetylglucosamine-1-phosphate transferase